MEKQIPHFTHITQLFHTERIYFYHSDTNKLFFFNFDTFPEKYIVHIFCSPARVRRIDHCFVHEKDIFPDIK